LQWITFSFKRNKILKALRCIGDLLVEDDEDTSLNLFSVASDAFTFMDVHRDRADCMVRIAAIIDRRGEIRNVVDPLQKARPLYESSSQNRDISKIYVKLQSFTLIVEKYETRLEWSRTIVSPPGPHPVNDKVSRLKKVERC
jgi:hypothetical protein